VFRDAERAVLRRTLDAFPEIGFLPKKAQTFVLWHRRGVFGRSDRSVLPGGLSGLLGDQDGLFGCACTQYRASMNEVARWARDRGLMDYAGQECVPREVSLMEAYHEGQQDRIATLQWRDGCGETLNIQEQPAEREPRLGLDDIFRLLRGAAVFRHLSDPECRWLAYVLRPIVLGPMERILIQGRPGSSLFLVVEGEFEVLVRQPDGVDLLTARVGAGATLGEMSLLTGAPRSATVRASIGGGVVLEIGKEQYQPVVRARPELVDGIAQLMAERAVSNRALARMGNVETERADLRRRIRKFFLGV
jgi:CRP-like cAMP-binding protein